jgi:hypothetical protein
VSPSLGVLSFDNVFELIRVDLIEVLAPAVESFKVFTTVSVTALMSFLRAADDGKVLGLGYALVAVYLV